MWWHGARHPRAFDHGYRAVVVDKVLISDPADILLSNLVDLVNLPEEFPPIAKTRLIGGEFRGQSGIVSQTPNEVRPGARLHHLEFIVGDVFFPQPIDLGVNGGTD